MSEVDHKNVVCRACVASSKIMRSTSQELLPTLPVMK